jgi:signal transduction histidine kinase/HAMP domain-containing protein
VSTSTRALDDVVSRVQRDVLGAAGLATMVAVLLATVFARSVARPILELRDDARAIAGGDLSRRPTLAAPGEVGELATAFHRLADELGTRLVALEADDALLRALTESLNEGVVAIDEQLRVVHMNENARRLLGARSTVPFPADELPRERTLREAVAAAGRGLSSDGLEMQLGERTIALTVRPLAKGGAVIALYDLTTIRRLESVRRDFVANVSHELKTPLTVVGGFAETLLDDELPAAQRRQFAEKIAGNTRRMQRLVDDLLDLSRIESGGWKPNPVRVDLRSVASELLAAASDRVEGRQIALLDEIPDDASGIYADPTALRQVLGNLVDNAVRHTSEGCIVLFSRRDSRGTLVGVRDTGTGIPPEHLPRLFERFYRVDAARSRNEGGTGLGLAIVKHLVEAHGGYVVAESRPTAGTTVSAWFPDARSLD